MSTRTLLMASALFMASLTPAFSESVTATVTAWDPASRTITLEDHSQFASIPSKVAVPEALKAGDVITINYEASESGVDSINRIEISTELAKRQAVPSQRRG